MRTIIKPTVECVGLGRKPGQANVAKADAKPDSAPRKRKTEEAAAE
jgi:hypothetical protein